jgi:putative membrane protein
MSKAPTPRQPRVFEGDDPSLEMVDVEPTFERASDSAESGAEDVTAGPPTEQWSSGAIRWGGILASSLAGLALLAAGSWLTTFAAQALVRDDWVGWTALSLVLIAATATLAIIVREAAGLFRLRRIVRLKAAVETALEQSNAKAERTALRHLLSTLDGRPDMRWPLARYREHAQNVADPGDLAKLADREVFAPLDQRAKRAVLASAKRVSVVTTLSPMAFIAVVFVLAENLRMLRAIATLYGGRPGLMAALRLGRMVVTHLVATGGLALTDDLLGQVLGHDLIRRVSRRLGEGALNGAMTARIGTAAILVLRPLPFLETTPVRVRDFLVEIFKRPADKTPAR